MNTSTISPLALIAGKPFTTIPQDLYIPPDALEVILESFEGPLDLLLYLIKKQNLDILNIPIAEITAQYMEYVELMRKVRLELAAEYLVMAALLAEIKSRLLLPRSTEIEEEEGDPRAELIRRLQEYERFKKVAEEIDEIPRLHRDIFQTQVIVPDKQLEHKPPDVELNELLLAFKSILQRAELFSSHQIEKETLSLRERMSKVLDLVDSEQFIPFHQLFNFDEGREGVVVSFIAILELIKESLIELVQQAPFAPIYIKAKASSQ